MNYQKRLSAPKNYSIERKEGKYITVGKGSRELDKSIPLVVILRDLLGILRNKKEVKNVLKEGKVLVDGKKVKDPSLSIGFMDVISMPESNTYYRLLVDNNGLKLKEISKKESKKKICRIEDKKILKGGKTQINLHDSANLVIDDDYSVDDSLLLDLPQKNIEKTLKFEKGNLALVSSGKHSGEVAEIKDIQEREGSNPSIVILENENEFETIKPYVYVIGEKEAEVDIDAES